MKLWYTLPNGRTGRVMVTEERKPDATRQEVARNTLLPRDESAR